MSDRARNNVSGIDAVILIAADFEAQCRFYEEVLGLEVDKSFGDAVFFRAGEQILGIFSRDHHYEGTKRLGQADHGLSHLEFQIEDNLKGPVMAKLKAAGAHAYRDNFQDPDGNLFHFNFVHSKSAEK